MQCPKCGYEPTLKELQSSPGDCVACGVNFEKYQQIQAREADEAAQKRGAIAAAKKSSPAVWGALQRHPGAQPVVVIDIQMNFWSMVGFMVKWAFATIPAILIIMLIVWGFVSWLGAAGWIVSSIIR